MLMKRLLGQKFWLAEIFLHNLLVVVPQGQELNCNLQIFIYCCESKNKFVGSSIIDYSISPGITHSCTAYTVFHFSSSDEPPPAKVKKYSS